MTTPADLERLARMCEHARQPDPKLGREILLAAFGWRREGGELYAASGALAIKSSDGDPLPSNRLDPTASIDAAAAISNAQLVSVAGGVVTLADGSEGNARTLPLAWSAAGLRALAKEMRS